MKKEKPRTPRKSFSERLAEKLGRVSNVEAGRLSDGSGRWVDVLSGKFKLNIGFDDKGETIESIELFREVWEKTGEEKVLDFKSSLLSKEEGE